MLVDTAFLSELGDSVNTDDQNVDSVTLSGTTLTTYVEDGGSAGVSLDPVIDSAVVRTKDSLLVDTAFLSELGDSINTDDQNVDSVTLTGTILTTYIENGGNSSVDLQPILDSATGNAWLLGGNSGTNSTTDFLGTSDNTDLVFRRNSALSGLIGADNTSFGNSSLSSLTTGFSNTAFGALSLQANSGGFGNVGVGFGALFANTSGVNNIAIGTALGSNTTGSFNIAIGNDVLSASTSSSFNIAIGYLAMDSNTTGIQNVSLGVGSLTNNTTGSRNVSIGTQSLASIEPGNNNTAIGFSALDSLITGSNNIALGYATGDNLVTGINNIIIGSNIDMPTSTDSNVLNIGNIIYGNDIDGTTNTLSTGNIGIGVKVPTNRLHVEATTDPLRLGGLTTAGINDTSLLVTDPSNGVVKYIAIDSVGSDDQNLSVGAGVDSTAIIQIENGNNVTIEAGIGLNITEDADTITLETNNVSEIQTVTTDYTVVAANHTVLVDASGGAVTVTLPVAATSAGDKFIIKTIDASNNVTVDGAGAETIDGAATQSLNVLWQGIQVQSNGTGWFIINRF